MGRLHLLFLFLNLYPSACLISLQTLMSVRYFLEFVQMDAVSIAKDLFIVSVPKASHWMELAVCVWVRFMSLCILCLKPGMDFSYFLGIHLKLQNHWVYSWKTGFKLDIWWGASLEDIF